MPTRARINNHRTGHVVSIRNPRRKATMKRRLARKSSSTRKLVRQAVPDAVLGRPHSAFCVLPSAFAPGLP
jgi:transposase